MIKSNISPNIQKYNFINNKYSPSSSINKSIMKDNTLNKSIES
jgi:hypothetical protein